MHALEWYKLIVQGAVLTGPALKVPSVKDGKIPTKKVKTTVCHRESALVDNAQKLEVGYEPHLKTTSTVKLKIKNGNALHK